jgi:sugar/nucleoside kinase (ribokinase family)
MIPPVSWSHLILVFGTICIDRLRRVPHLPIPGGYVGIEQELLLLGGEAANTANALVVWGDEIAFTGNRIGRSSDSDVLWRLINSNGLPTELISRPGPEQLDASLPDTPVCDIYVTPDGERTMFGKGFDTVAPDIAPSDLPFVAGEWFTAEPNMASPSREAAKLATAAGMNNYLMDFIRDGDPIAPGSFWQSSTDWAGHRNNVQRNVQWVKDWVTRHGCYTILSDGPNGFVFGGPDRSTRAYPPFPSPVVVDTTGAGDVFRAGMLHGLDKDWTLPDCLRFAAAAGCLKCRALGATTDVPTVSEIISFIQANPDVAAAYG